MATVSCSGLPASWINGWLAAVGATVLDSRIRLSWSPDATPVAVLAANDSDPVELLTESWPTETALDELPLACNWNGGASLRRRIPVEVFWERARMARRHPQAWTISSTLTDLHVDKKGEVAHAPFDPAGPGTIKWLHERLKKVHLVPSIEQIMDSFAGRAARVSGNGLGFDQARLGSLADSGGGILVDPVVEVLAFFGLALLPVRGRGTDERLGSARPSTIQRGWQRVRVGDESHPQLRFLWPAWSHPLDLHGIDALLDAWKPKQKHTWQRLGVHRAWSIVPYRGRATADSTRALGSTTWDPQPRSRSKPTGSRFR